jgi:chromatin remodeling complex protein RSC6
MPKKAVTKTKKEDENIQDKKKVEVENTEKSENTEKKTRKVKKNKDETVAITETETKADNNSEEKVPKTRKQINKETLQEEFDALIEILEKEIDKLRENTKSKGVKTLRSIAKKVKSLKTHSLKVAKNTRSARTSTNTGGFVKPVKLSKELCSFLGIKEDETRSRVEVTKFVCNYIKEKNLQDPLDRRNILYEKDENLKKLLVFDNTVGPLTYWRLQSALKTHFMKIESPSTSTESNKPETENVKTKSSKPKPQPEPSKKGMVNLYR